MWALSPKSLPATATRNVPIDDLAATALLVIDTQRFLSVPGLGVFRGQARTSNPYFFDRVDVMTGNISKLLQVSLYVLSFPQSSHKRSVLRADLFFGVPCI
jgi:hypothetical protein